MLLFQVVDRNFVLDGEPWAVPWTGETIVQVFSFFLSFFFSWVSLLHHFQKDIAKSGLLLVMKLKFIINFIKFVIITFPLVSSPYSR